MKCFKFAVLLGIASIATAARAEPDPDPAVLPSVVVVGRTPLVGADVDSDKIPEATWVLGARDVNRTGIPNLTDAILDHVPSVSVNGTEGNVFQPGILFRGFTASPVAGTPQGLAVYMNGARFNDAFGDTVNWDVIPPSAIESVNVEAPNPLFGLNALGGSINVRLKSGFTTTTQDATLYGGSYGREAAILEYGRQFGPFAIYIVGDATHDDGFRQTSTSNLYRLYTDLGWRSQIAEAHLGITASHDKLGNPGATPVQALAANIANIFTAPNEVDNNFLGVNLNGNYRLSESNSLQGLAYFHTLNQVVPNGITSQVTACGDGSGLVCNSDGSIVTTLNGAPVSDFRQGGPYSGLSVQQLNSHAYGASAQLSDSSLFSAHANHFVGGLSFDGSDSVFAGVQQLGGFDPYTRQFLGPGVVLDQPDLGVLPVRVRSTTRFYGVFATDTFQVTSDLDANVAGRFNDAEVDLEDKLGGPVNGRHTFRRFNPSGGLTYRLSTWLQLYASYSETNRAPTPQELSCASAAAPCSLLNFFVGDPNLNQVVARTVEAGLRGHTEPRADGQLSWNLDVYRTSNTNDIIYESTVYDPNLAFYTNAGRTRRQGVETNLRYDNKHLHVSLGYAFTDATFRSALVLNSPNNPAADANGQQQVVSGNRIPGIPRHRAALVADYSLTDRWTLGSSVVTQGNAYRFGDEANLTAPVGGYTLVDLNVAFHVGERFTVFAVVNNVLNKRYETYGTFGPIGDVPWPNVPGGVNDPRTASPGTPVTAYGGARVSF